MTFKEKFKIRSKQERTKQTNVNLRRFLLSILPFAGNFWIWKYKMPVDYKSYQLIVLIVTLITIFN